MDAISKFLTDNWKSLISAVVAGVFVSGGLVAYNTWIEQKETAAQEQLFALKKRLEDRQSEIQKAQAQKTEKKPATLTPEKLQEDLGTILQDFRKFIGENTNRKAAAMAAVDAAKVAATYKDWVLASELLGLVEASVKPGGLFFGLVHAQLGTVQMELNKYKEAIEHFDLILASEELKYSHPEALLRKAACHIELKEWDQAESALAKIESEAGPSQAAMSAKGLKRLMLLRKAEG